MTDIRRSRECGNAPKNSFVQEAAITAEVGRLDPDHLDDDGIWKRSLGETLIGKSAALNRRGQTPTPSAVTIERAISHSRIDAAHDKATDLKGLGRRFCHVAEFRTARADRIALIKSYE